MRILILAVFVCALTGCGAKDKDYASVPASVPDEGKPIWLAIKACESEDVALYRKVMTEETRQAIEKRGRLEDSFRKQRMNYQNWGITTASAVFTVSYRNAELFKKLGVSDNASLKPGYAFVELRGPRNVAGVLVRKVGDLWQIDANPDRPLQEVIDGGAAAGQ